jgi:hypothetical protein
MFDGNVLVRNDSNVELGVRGNLRGANHQGKAGSRLAWFEAVIDL